MKIKNFFSSISDKQLSRGGLWAICIGAVVSTVSGVVETVRRDKRNKKLYATLQVKADAIEVPTLAKTAGIAEESYAEE